MNFSIFLVTFILAFINFSQTLKVIVEKGRDFCVNKEVEKDDILKGSFVISGEKEDSVQVTLIGPNSFLYYENKFGNYLKPNGEFTITIETGGKYDLCFSNKYNHSSIVAFEFLTINESGHLLSIAKDEVMEDMYKNVTNVSYLFEEIEKNLKFYAERKETHATILKDAMNTVQKVNIYKISIIILISLLQIFFIKKLFKSRDYTKYQHDTTKKSTNQAESFKL
jgi:hypothetical protein